MLEMLITVGIVILIILVIGLIVSVFANITLGTPTPIDIMVRPISAKIGSIIDERKVIKKASEYENNKVKSVKTYELKKEHVKEMEHKKEHVKDYTPTMERTIDDREVTKTDEKVKELKK